MQKVIVFGTFDIVHPGHLYLIRKARAQGDQVIVVVARDKTVEKTKGVKLKHDEKARLKKLTDMKLAHDVVLGDEDNPFKIVDSVKPDVICLGYDQKTFVEQLEKHLKETGLNAKILRINPYKPNIYHSTRFRKESPQLTT